MSGVEKMVHIKHIIVSVHSYTHKYNHIHIYSHISAEFRIFGHELSFSNII